jgi:hypothetical protein
VFQFDMAVARQRARHLQRGEHLTSVATGTIDEQRQGVGVCGRSFRLEPAAHQRLDRPAVERLETEEGRAAAQRCVDLEERVLGRRSDQGQRAVLDRREQCVLLRLGEPVDLVEEQDRSLTPLAQTLAGPLDGLADVLDPGVDGRQLLEGAVGAARNGECQRGLAGAGRTPQQRRGQPVGLHQPPQRLAEPTR